MGKKTTVNWKTLSQDLQQMSLLKIYIKIIGTVLPNRRIHSSLETFATDLNYIRCTILPQSYFFLISSCNYKHLMIQSIACG